MKKVRFETPVKAAAMDDYECHSPRPFLAKQVSDTTGCEYGRILPYSADPMLRYESSNSSPYPLTKKTSLASLNERSTAWEPSNDLDLSMLDCSYQEPRTPLRYKSTKFPEGNGIPVNEKCTQPAVTSSVSNKSQNPPNILVKDDNFFIKPGGLDKCIIDTKCPQNRLNRLNTDKENTPLGKGDIKPKTVSPVLVPKMQCTQTTQNCARYECRCYHCVRIIQSTYAQNSPFTELNNPSCNHVTMNAMYQCQCVVPSPKPNPCLYTNNKISSKCHNSCKCINSDNTTPEKVMNAVDQKTWAIERYEQSKKTDCVDLEKQTNIKEKREPTVADLFKIIKLQNEQLQLLQEKVDKFISSSNQRPQSMQALANHNHMTESVALQTTGSDISEQHKISIGVMTSFEVVRTSTVINKEFVTQTKENAQIQCNRSQISIKEVVSKAQPVNLNFLDGIMPKEQTAFSDEEIQQNYDRNNIQGNLNDEKTVNELSLYNIQVDNATTPMVSPEQSLYLDVKDYSDSESDSNESNVGWTYYNKVMTHVNGMLQDSDMPSSASALYRNTRQHCVQMQVDKTNLSVTKRVKFGDDPLGVLQPHISAVPSTDTSLKMNQLAAKYLKQAPVQQKPMIKQIMKPIDMSYATRNYMKEHNLLQEQHTTKSPASGDMPRFLDRTAIQQQPKLL